MGSRDEKKFPHCAAIIITQYDDMVSASPNRFAQSVCPHVTSHYLSPKLCLMLLFCAEIKAVKFN